MSVLNSHNEWDKLKEVIVGTSKKSFPVITWRKNYPLKRSMLDEVKKIAQQANPEWYINEVEEDLEGLSKIIEDFGAKVLRPTPYEGSKVFSTQN